MLSLKPITRTSAHHVSSRSTPPPPGPAPPRPNRSSLLDLPNELLKQIIQILGQEQQHHHFRHRGGSNSGGATETLLPLALTCGRLRGLTQARLFESVDVVLSRRVTRAGETLVDLLLRKAGLRNCVRVLKVREGWGEVDEGEAAKLDTLLGMLGDLRELWLYSLTRSTRFIAEFMRSHGQHLDVVINETQCGLADDDDNDDSGSTLEGRDYLVASQLSGCRSVSLGMGDWGILSKPWPLSARFTAGPNLKALRSLMRNKNPFLIGETEAVEMLTSLEALQTQEHGNDEMPKFHALEEVHMDYGCILANGLIQGAERMQPASWLKGIVWHNVRRLELQFDWIAMEFLPLFTPHLCNLVSLTLNGVESMYNHLPLRRPSLALSELKNLQELEFEYNNKNRYTIRSLANPNLRRLKFHRISRWETGYRVGSHPDILHVACLKFLARNCPHLEDVEVDVGNLLNLWHPTAIPGVDVDVQVYQALTALASLPKLKHLRLFPPYRLRSHGQYPRHAPFQQPLRDDEQAIKIFNFLKAQRPTLQTLAISAEAKSAANLELTECYAMSWEMHERAGKTILITKQAGKDYEQRQVWEGKRRLRTETKRFAWKKPYLPRANGWILHN